jgi:hypothetical protein
MGYKRTIITTAAIILNFSRVRETPERPHLFRCFLSPGFPELNRRLGGLIETNSVNLRNLDVFNPRKEGAG